MVPQEYCSCTSPLGTYTSYVQQQITVGECWEILDNYRFMHAPDKSIQKLLEECDLKLFYRLIERDLN